MKVVLIKNVKYNYENIREVVDGSWEGSVLDPNEFVQLSEVAEVEFVMLPPESVVQGDIDIIDRQITKVQADAESAITALTGRKQELLAIGCD